MQMKPYCIAKGALMKGKRSTFERKRSLFGFVILHNNTHKQHNTLYTSTITAARSKLENFGPKISSCAQLAVLSNKNANIVQERSLGLYKYNEKSSTTNAMLLIIVI